MSARHWACGAWAALLLGLQAPVHAALQVVIIEGLGGTPLYAQQFDAQAQALQSASRRLTAARDVHLMNGAAASRAAVIDLFHQLRRVTRRDDQLILYLIGHGSFDGRQYKFNLPGPDLSGHDLTLLLDALPAQQQLVVATGSSSGALLAVLMHPHRALITATRNGDEKNVTHFGAAFVAALNAAQADTNKDGLISAREAYDYANQQVQQYFRQQTLLASEHAVFEGTEAARLTVASLGPTTMADDGAARTRGDDARAPLPAALARQRATLNARIQALERRKGGLAPAAYEAQLEQLLLQLAEVQQRIDGAANPGGEAAHAP